MSARQSTGNSSWKSWDAAGKDDASRLRALMRHLSESMHKHHQKGSDFDTYWAEMDQKNNFAHQADRERYKKTYAAMYSRVSQNNIRRVNNSGVSTGWTGLAQLRNMTETELGAALHDFKLLDEWIKNWDTNETRPKGWNGENYQRIKEDMARWLRKHFGPKFVMQDNFTSEIEVTVPDGAVDTTLELNQAGYHEPVEGGSGEAREPYETAGYDDFKDFATHMNVWHEPDFNAGTIQGNWHIWEAAVTDMQAEIDNVLVENGVQALESLAAAVTDSNMMNSNQVDVDRKSKERGVPYNQLDMWLERIAKMMVIFQTGKSGMSPQDITTVTGDVEKVVTAAEMYATNINARWERICTTAQRSEAKRIEKNRLVAEKKRNLAEKTGEREQHVRGDKAVPYLGIMFNFIHRHFENVPGDKGAGINAVLDRLAAALNGDPGREVVVEKLTKEGFQWYARKMAKGARKIDAHICPANITLHQRLMRAVRMFRRMRTSLYMTVEEQLNSTSLKDLVGVWTNDRRKQDDIKVEDVVSGAPRVWNRLLNSTPADYIYLGLNTGFEIKVAVKAGNWGLKRGMGTASSSQRSTFFKFNR